MKYAPIIIPTLCRYKHFTRLIESLKRNGWAKFTDIYVGLDYPPSDKYKEGWNQICEYVEKGDFSVFASFTVLKHTKNLGSFGNLGSLYNIVASRYDRYIIMEDDIEASSVFIEYIDKCLDRYENDPDVVGVTGYSYPVEWDVSEDATIIKQNFCASAWGTGFWINKSTAFRNDIFSGKHLDRINAVIKERLYERMIDASLREYIPAAVSPFRKMQKMMLCTTDIAIRAYLAVENKYYVQPVISKTRNHGFDGSGKYCQLIDEGINGSTAGTYNYSRQPIDKSNTFNLVPDSKNNLNENRDRLNRFDVRTLAQMRRTRLYLWLMTHVGVWAGRACAWGLFPADVALRLYRKLQRMT